MKFPAVRRRRALACLCLPLLSVNIATATASTASVAITSGNLSIGHTSVTVAGENPTTLDVRLPVADARGTGAGWFLSLAADSPGGSGTRSLLITGADAACAPGTVCTVADNDIAYPIPVSLTGERTWVYEAEASSGLGAQTVEFQIVVPPSVPNALSLSFSVSTQPGGTDRTSEPPDAEVAPHLPPCSVREMTTTGTC